MLKAIDESPPTAIAKEIATETMRLPKGVAMTAPLSRAMSWLSERHGNGKELASVSMSRETGPWREALMKFGAALRQLRLEVKLTQRRLAQVVGKSDSTLSALELGDGERVPAETLVIDYIDGCLAESQVDSALKDARRAHLLAQHKLLAVLHEGFREVSIDGEVSVPIESRTRRRRLAREVAQADPVPPPTVSAFAQDLWFPEDGLIFAGGEPLASEERQRIEQAIGADRAEAAATNANMLRIASLFDLRGPTLQFSRHQLILEGNHASPVLIREIKAYVLHAGPPAAGSILFGSPEGESDVVQVAFDLDSSNPIARKPTLEGRPTETPYFKEHFITLDPQERVVLLVTAYTKRYCEWQIHVSIMGQQSPLIVQRSDGRPFRTTAISAIYKDEYVYDLAGGRFVRHMPGKKAPWGRR